MGRTKEQQREYMREYRHRKAQDHAAYDRMKPVIGAIKTDASARIRELEEEVRHLKEELAKRPPSIQEEVARALDAGRERAVREAFPGLPGGRVFAEPEFNTRPFTPVPKKGK